MMKSQGRGWLRPGRVLLTFLGHVNGSSEKRVETEQDRLAAPPYSG